MPFPKIAEVRELSDEELTAEIVKVKRELFDLRILKATGRIEKTHLFKQNRHRLAQLLTIEKERQHDQKVETDTVVETPENTE